LPKAACGRVLRPAAHVDAHAALDPLHRQAGTAQQFGGLARPRRQGAQPRHDEARHAAGLGIGHAVAGLQDAAQCRQVGAGTGVGVDPVAMPGTGDAQAGDDGVEAGLQAVASERRQGGRALEDDHVRLTVATGRLV
jgi:hypothetical protein